MTFDLHIHTLISDGWLCPDTSADLLRQHADYVTVTDHNNPSYHSRKNTGCSFTGVELSAYIDHNERIFSIECLFYGFPTNETLLLKRRSPQYLPTLTKQLTFIKKKANAKLFLAHPYYSGLYGNEMIAFLNTCAPYVDGFECLHFSAPGLDDVILLLDYCRKNGKLASGGSDSHGDLEKTPYLHLIPEYYELFKWIPEMAKKTLK